MSVSVELAALKDRVAQYGETAFLVTGDGQGRPHVVSVRLTWDGDHLVLPAGRSTRANVQRQPAVTLLWPPKPEPGYCLIVDATFVTMADDESTITAEPTHAILHRMADQT